MTDAARHIIVLRHLHAIVISSNHVAFWLFFTYFVTGLVGSLNVLSIVRGASFRVLSFLS